MEKDSFKDGCPGNLVKSLEGNWAYRPHQPPRQLQLTPEQAELLHVADVRLGRLDGIASWLPKPEILIRSFARREAVLSSNIENTFADYEELARFELDEKVQKRNQDAREVHNAERAIMFGLEAVREKGRPLSLSLLREMHSILLEHVRGKELMRGAFRKKQVYIGNEAKGITGARFVPPPHHMLDELMTGLEEFLGDRGILHPIVHSAIAHYQFETIHPFEDGNGRLGRVLILLLFCHSQQLRTPVLNPSLYFEMHRREYYDALLRVSQDGAWGDWITYFTKGVTAAADDAIDRLERIRVLRTSYHQKLHSSRNSALLLKLLDDLFDTPAISIGDAARLLKVTYPAAKKSVEKLEAAGILQEAPGTHLPKVFIARDILSLLRVGRTEQSSPPST